MTLFSSRKQENATLSEVSFNGTDNRGGGESKRTLSPKLAVLLRATGAELLV